MKKTSNKPKNAQEFDEYFENHDISDLLDTSTKRVNIDLPSAFLSKLDNQAQILGVSRQSLVKIWLAERLNII